MHDLFGIELLRWTVVENRLKEIFCAYGYQEIRTPVLENIDVFSQTVGEETDLVEKQMYGVKTESETLVLRPEGTSSFMRAVIEHELHQPGAPQRYYYYLPMFRHERPQKGRQRQFFQFGAEFIQDGSPYSDAELIALMTQLTRAVGILSSELRLNSVGCLECRPRYKEKLKGYLTPHLPGLCAECQKRFERSVLRVLDCKQEKCRSIVKDAPKMIDSICEACSKHHGELKTLLGKLKISFVEDPSIVRGLDYYTRTAFELTSNELGAQSALGGGGRYDGLSARFGEKSFPAVGFAIGMERVMLLIAENSPIFSSLPKAQLFLAPLGPQAYHHLFPILFQLRERGLWVEMLFDPEKNIKHQLRYANKIAAPWVLILGDDELKNGQAVLKNMKSGEQRSLALDRLVEQLEQATVGVENQ